MVLLKVYIAPPKILGTGFTFQYGSIKGFEDLNNAMKINAFTFQYGSIKGLQLDKSEIKL